MNKAVTIIVGCLVSVTAVAQCTSSIPSNAVVITSSTGGVVPQSNTNFWICNGAFQQVFTGSNNQFWVETNAGFNSINGNGNTIRYKGTMPLGIFGSNNVIYATSATAISNQGSGNTINPCGANQVVFNYASAPAGCGAVSVGELGAEALAVQYDAVADAIRVQGPVEQVRELRVLDTYGRLLAVQGTSGLPVVHMGRYPSGAYIVQLITEMGPVNHRFVK